MNLSSSQLWHGILSVLALVAVLVLALRGLVGGDAALAVIVAIAGITAPAQIALADRSANSSTTAGLDAGA